MPVKLNTDKSTLTDGQLELLSSEDGHIPVQGLNGEECLVCIALNDLQKTRAQLALADKVIQAARGLINCDTAYNDATNAMDRGVAQGHFGMALGDLRERVAEYDRERATP